MLVLHIKDTSFASLQIRATTKSYWSFPKVSFTEALFNLDLHF